MTVAGALNVYATVVDVASVPSIVGGVTRILVSVNAVGAVPIVPEAGRTVGPASSAHEYGTPGSALRASQVQSTAVPVPDPAATTLPVASFTVTVHGRLWVSRAVKRTDPPTAPDTVGTKSLGRPVRATSWAIAGSSR